MFTDLRWNWCGGESGELSDAQHNCKCGRASGWTHRCSLTSALTSSLNAREIRGSANDPAAAERTAAIASISDQDWYVTRTYGVFHIPACAKGEACAVLIVTPRGDAIDLGDHRRLPFTITPREIAEDIVQDLENHGIFVCAFDARAFTD